MKHKTWFRLVLRAIGVALIGFSLPYLAQSLSTLIPNFMGWSSMGGFGFDYIWAVGPGVGGLAQLIAGLYLFFGGKWIVNKAIPSNRPYCPECGYDLSKSTGDRCVECGTALPLELLRQPAAHTNDSSDSG